MLKPPKTHLHDGVLVGLFQEIVLRGSRLWFMSKTGQGGQYPKNAGLWGASRVGDGGVFEHGPDFTGHFLFNRPFDGWIFLLIGRMVFYQLYDFIFQPIENDGPFSPAISGGYHDHIIAKGVKEDGLAVTDGFVSKDFGMILRVNFAEARIS
jgi:hypothetical protein